MKKLLLGLIAALVISGNVFAQSAIIRGEVTPGVYEVLKSTSQALNVTVVGTAPPAGVTAVVMTTTTPTVTNASTTILAANTARKNVMIQNNHATADVHLNFTTSATLSHLKISAGQSLFLTGIVPTAAVQAIGSVASNTSVVVIEGI